MSSSTCHLSRALCALTVVACTGRISESSGGGSEPGNPVAGSPSAPGRSAGSNGGPGAGAGAGNGNASGGGGSSGPSTGADPMAAGPMPLRMLTRREYNNTVRDLLGITSRPADDFPADNGGESIFPIAPVVDSLRASRLADAAAALAGAADLTMPKVLPCKPAAGSEEACAGQFIDQFGARAFRRPVLPAERTRLLGLYREGRTTGGLDFEGGVRLLIEAMLQSTGFLYHWEVGVDPAMREGKVIRLGPYQVASRLSYFLWGSMPDEQLLAAAAANRLGTEAEVGEQARRLLADPRARETATTFFDEWLGLDQLPGRSKDTAVYPEFKTDLKTAMAAELQALSSKVAFDGDGRLETILTSTTAQISGSLAAIYGLKGTFGATPQAIELDRTQRAGILTRAGFQAVFGGAQGSHPIKRGVEVYTRVLCREIPPPPADVPPPKPASAGGTTRSRFAEHSQNACASGCHGLFDGIGYAFEIYDGVGRYRTVDNGSPVDASGSVELDGKQVSFKDGLDLSRLLAASGDVKRCLATQLASFGLGRGVVAADRASLDGAVGAYERPTATLRDLMVALASSRTFRYRAPVAGEVMP